MLSGERAGQAPLRRDRAPTPPPLSAFAARRGALLLPLPCTLPVVDVGPELRPRTAALEVREAGARCALRPLRGGRRPPTPPRCATARARPPRPLQGPFAPNDALRRAVRLFEGAVRGSESVAVAPDGTMVMCDKFGWVWEAKAAAGTGVPTLARAPLAHLGPGRPLGFHHDAAGNLYVCMAGAGLVKLDAATKAVTVAASAVSLRDPVAPGSPILYANDLDVAPDGTVYFTDSTPYGPARNRAGFWDTMEAYTLSLLAGAPAGRLLAHTPGSGTATVVSDGLWFANGVAVAPGGAWAAVAETTAARVWRVELQGPDRGKRSILIDRLPGFPDGVTRAREGGFWVSIVVPAQPGVDALLSSRLARWLYGWSPTWARPPVKQWGCVVRVTEAGKVVQTLMDADGSRVASTSAVTPEPTGGLLIGSLMGDYVSWLRAEDVRGAGLV